MSFRELSRMIDQLVKDRGIKKDVIIKAIEQAFLVTSRKKFGIQGEYEVKYNEKDDDIEIFQYKNVVQNIKDPILEIAFNEAKNLDPDCEVGDQLGSKIENPGFTRVDVQTAKQIIFQKVRDAEREILFKEFKHREGELVTGIARRYERGNIIVDLGKADAILSKREIIPGENFKPGDRIQAFLSEVVMTNRGPEICLTRTSPMFLVKLFEVEVPEIQDGTIEIKSAAREPGLRAKIAVYTSDKDIDPVGACVGIKGSRVQNIVNELQGEKIDVVPWFPDIENFVKKSLAPAEITSMMLAEDRKSIDVIVEDNQLSLAIGKRGQNVRLAAILTGQKINIISKSKLQERVKKAVENLLQLSSLTDAHAQVFVHEGIMSIKDLKQLSVEEINEISGMDKDSVGKLLEEINILEREEKIKLTLDGEEEIISASAIPTQSGSVNSDRSITKEGPDKFSEAEKRLREELAAFKIK
ncbi:MAG: transcription termination/antitermination protein NusA [Oligoflexia bacterium]|nr:transcription termination/antitermination protein NusA [Oligoflexia bacterium]